MFQLNRHRKDGDCDGARNRPQNELACAPVDAVHDDVEEYPKRINRHLSQEVPAESDEVYLNAEFGSAVEEVQQ